MGSWFNKVAKFVVHPAAALNKVGLDFVDKGLRGFGLDLFGNKQQQFNNDIAQENNQLQQQAFEFNKDMASSTFKTNKDLAYNGSQIKSADMAKAGLNPLAGVNSSPSSISASNVDSPNLMQSQQTAQTGLQKIQTVAGLAMQAKQLQSSLSSAAINDQATKAQTRYQNLVNEYFDKHGVLPTQQNEWIAQLLPLFQKAKSSSTLQQVTDNIVDKVIDSNQKGSESAQSSTSKFKSMPDLSKLTKSSYIKLVFTGAGMKKFPPNEKGFLDWCKTKDGQQVLKGNDRNLIRDFFFWIKR